MHIVIQQKIKVENVDDDLPATERRRQVVLGRCFFLFHSDFRGIVIRFQCGFHQIRKVHHHFTVSTISYRYLPQFLWQVFI